MIAALLTLSFATVRAGNSVPENIIFMIGDGMSMSHVTLTRIATGDLSMDEFSEGGIVTTYQL